MTKILFFSFFVLLSCSLVQENQSTKRAPSSFKSVFDQIQEKIANAKERDREQGLKRVQRFEVFNRVFGNQDLIKLHKGKSADIIKEHNQLILDMLKIGPQDSSSEIPYVTLEEAKKVYQDIINSKVVANKSIYDSSGREGYCFGRAIIGHVEAIAHGLDPRAVKKIWTIGNWSHYPFHVAVLLRGKEGWYAIDQTYLGVISAQEWIERSIPSEVATDKPNMIFVTDGDRFSLHNALPYRSIDFFSTTNEIYNKEGDFYRGYFKDFFEELEMQQVKPFDSKNIESKSPNLFIQYDIIKKMQTLYPHALSRSEWKDLYHEFDEALLSKQEELRSLTNVHDVLKYRLMLLDVADKLKKSKVKLENDVHSAKVLVEISHHLESVYGSTRPEVKKALDDLFLLPIGEVDRYLKILLSLQINRKLSYEIVVHYVVEGYLEKTNAYHQEIVDLILKQDYFDEKTKERVKNHMNFNKANNCNEIVRNFISTN